MQKTILYTLLCLGSLRAAAQTTDNSSTSTDIGLQHTVAANISTNSESVFLYSVLYDLRLRNLYRKLDLAFGADFGYVNDTRNLELDNPNTSSWKIKKDGAKATLRCVAIIGRKNVAFEAGLQFSYSSFHSLNNIVYDPSYNNPNTSYEEYRNRFAIGIPLGVRYQPARSSVFVALALDLSVWRAATYIADYENSITAPSRYKTDAVGTMLDLNRIRLSVGYTFPVKYQK